MIPSKENLLEFPTIFAETVGEFEGELSLQTEQDTTTI